MFESILLTGRADKQDVIKALRIGIADYYQKAGRLDELLEGIKRQDTVLQERKKTEHLGHLNQKMQFLAESIDGLYHDMESVLRPEQNVPFLKLPEHVQVEGEVPHLFKQLSQVLQWC